MLTMEQFLGRCMDACQSDAQLVWLADEQVLEAGIAGWTELPLWIAESDIESGGLFYADNGRAIKRGLELMPIDKTIKDTLAWSRASGDAEKSPLLVKALSLSKEQATLERFGVA
jgi:2'-hydroxyisoflavone reductase